MSMQLKHLVYYLNNQAYGYDINSMPAHAILTLIALVTEPNSTRALHLMQFMPVIVLTVMLLLVLIGNNRSPDLP